MGACIIKCMRFCLTKNDNFNYEVHDGKGHHKLLLRIERDNSCQSPEQKNPTPQEPAEPAEPFQDEDRSKLKSS